MRNSNRNDLLGLEGMVKLKNPDEHHMNGMATLSIEPNSKSVASETESKRYVYCAHWVDAMMLIINECTFLFVYSGQALHRIEACQTFQYPIPINWIPDPICMQQLATKWRANHTEGVVSDHIAPSDDFAIPTTSNIPFYVTATSSLKKQVSVSQHSSISQTDDLSSPYARVRSPLHAYDKVRPAEHPYAQLKSSGNDNSANVVRHGNASTSNDTIDGNSNEENSLSRRGSHQSLLDVIDSHQQQAIPAASAIAGRVSASLELPYMTPPIVQPQQHFSGDSQDSSSKYIA